MFFIHVCTTCTCNLCMCIVVFLCLTDYTRYTQICVRNVLNLKRGIRRYAYSWISSYIRLAHSTVGHFFTVFRARLALTWTVKKDIILNYGGCRVSLLTTVDQTGNVYCGIK